MSTITVLEFRHLTQFYSYVIQFLYIIRLISETEILIFEMYTFLFIDFSCNME